MSKNKNKIRKQIRREKETTYGQKENKERIKKTEQQLTTNVKSRIF
jgi:hypothetical protein